MYPLLVRGPSASFCGSDGLALLLSRLRFLFQLLFQLRRMPNKFLNCELLDIRVRVAFAVVQQEKLILTERLQITWRLGEKTLP